MMTSPSNDLRNPKPREMGCLNCNYIILTAEFEPKCENCGQLLNKIVYSILDGRRITGREFEQK